MQNHSSGAQPTPVYTVPHLMDKEQGFTKYMVFHPPQPAINFIANLILLFSLHEQPNISWLWNICRIQEYIV